MEQQLGGGADHSLDDDLAELLEIRLHLDGANSAERIRLRERQRELRSRWSSGYGDMATDRLAALEKALVAQRQEVLNRHLDIASTGNKGGDGGGLDPLATMEHNQMVDETHGRKVIEQQLIDVRIEIHRRRTKI